MKVYIQLFDGSAWLVQAEPVSRHEARVHHPEHGYSIWPLADFIKHHRLLTREETQLINMSTAELQIMQISEPGNFNVLTGMLALDEGRQV